MVSSDPNRRGIDIYSSSGSPVVAVNDGEIKKVGRSESSVAMSSSRTSTATPTPTPASARSPGATPYPKRDLEQQRTGARAVKANAANDPKPSKAASRGQPGRGQQGGRCQAVAAEAHPSIPVKERLFANPARPNARAAGGSEQLLNTRKHVSTFKNYFSRPLGLDPKEYRLRPLEKGARVISGTILGRVGSTDDAEASHLHFEIRPAGKGAPKIDPKPILDGWKLLEATAIYRASGSNALHGDDSLSIGQILLLPTPALEKRVLNDERIEIYPCGRDDIRSGQINRRVLATLAYLAESGFRPYVSALKCGHSYLTAGGSVSWHSSGNAVGHCQDQRHSDRRAPGQGRNHRTDGSSPAEAPGHAAPDQLISLLNLGGPSFAMADHYDHIHVGFRPLFGNARDAAGKKTLSVLKPGQWEDLTNRLSKIDNPVVRTKPSDAAIPDRGSSHHQGD